MGGIGLFTFDEQPGPDSEGNRQPGSRSGNIQGSMPEMSPREWSRRRPGARPLANRNTPLSYRSGGEDSGREFLYHCDRRFFLRHADQCAAPSGYAPVTLVTLDGKRIRGTKKNEDAFSIQIMDTDQRLRSYLKPDLREVIDEKVSLMPNFTTALITDQQLDDLLSYLITMSAPVNGRR